MGLSETTWDDARDRKLARPPNPISQARASNNLCSNSGRFVDLFLDLIRPHPCLDRRLPISFCLNMYNLIGRFPASAPQVIGTPGGRTTNLCTYGAYAYLHR